MKYYLSSASIELVSPFFLTYDSEEILNPSVPIALRLSAILMGNLCKIHLNFSFQALFSTDLRITLALFGLSSGGVVIVYERKVKLLYGTLIYIPFVLFLSLSRI